MINKNTDEVTMLHNLSSEQILRLFNALHKEIENLTKHFQPKEPVEYLTREEAVQMLKCDQSTIHNWTVKGKLRKYCLGNRVYFKRSEIEAAMVAVGGPKDKQA